LFGAMLKTEAIESEGDTPNVLGGAWLGLRLRHPGADVFLVGNWVFNGPRNRIHGTAAYPYVDQFNYSPPAPDPPPGFDTLGASGQNNPHPPGFWSTGTRSNLGFAGDHALVKIKGSGEIYDPSYGTGPYRDIGGWARAAIKGWAFFTNAAGKTVKRSDCEGGKLPVCYMLAHAGVS